MDFTKATKTQLETIIKYEFTCSHSLLVGAVNELLNRNSFDALIAKAIRLVVHVPTFEVKQKINMDDLLQVGRMTVFKVMKRFNAAKSNSLLTFLFVTVKQEIIRVVQSAEASIRDGRKTVSHQKETATGEEIGFFFKDPKVNVEKFVVNKVTIEQLLSRVNPHQRRVVIYRLQGYKFDEIAKILGRGTVKSIHASYHDAIGKMKKGA
jgi:RNA polymerase sigma factor (sigma-70 family)